MKRIIEGVRKFQTEVYPEEKRRFRQLAHTQSPLALFITCSDSRVVPSMITQTDPGELFIIRNAGNIVPAHGEMLGGVSATIEYAVRVLNVSDIIVCGHSDCGALKGVLYPQSVEEMPVVQRWLHYAERARAVVEENDGSLGDEEKLLALIRENALAQIDHLMTHPCVAARVRKGSLRLHGWVFHIDTGEVSVFDQDESRFRPFREAYETEQAVSTT